MLQKIKNNTYHYALSVASTLLYRHPSRHMKVIGVTGTKGKTTTVTLLYHIFAKAGYNVSALSSVFVSIGDEQKKNPTGNSMPGSLFMQKFLSDAKQAHCEYAFVEVTSQGVLQHRHRFIHWNGCVFLDIHPEHIEAHGSFTNYLKAKRDFFAYAARIKKRAVHFFVNKDDVHAKDFCNVIHNHPLHQFSATETEMIQECIPQTLAGEYNKTNIVAAYRVATVFGISHDIFCSALKTFEGIPGRGEIICQKPFTVIVDYAHTPDSLRAVYEYAKTYKGINARMHCVLGSCGGGRDMWKRPQMGAIAAECCDHIVLADEDPYDEDPHAIVAMIKKGLDAYAKEHDKKVEVEIIIDRRSALFAVMSKAQEGDVIVLTGKGSENSIHKARGHKDPWSEKDIALEALKHKKSI